MDTDVLVVGAGPVGMASAISLGAFGIANVVCEARPGLNPHPRGRTLTTRTMEIFRRWGIEQEILDRSMPPCWRRRMIYAETLTGREYDRLEVDDSDLSAVSPSVRQVCTQDRVEPLLHERAMASGATTLRFDTTVEALEQDPEGVTVFVRDSAGHTSMIHARYVIAADGSGSTLRTSCEIEMVGPNATIHNLSIDFAADLRPLVADRPSVIYWVANRELYGLILVVDGKTRWILQTPYLPSAIDVHERFGPGVCTDLVRTAVGLPDLDVEVLRLDTWHVSVQVADTYRRGRVILAGDAAHRFPPTGGFGMNTGIQDADNLGWRLAGILHGWFGDDALAGYEAERRAIAMTNATWARSKFATIGKLFVAAGTGNEEKIAAAVAAQRDYLDYANLDLGFDPQRSGEETMAGPDAVRSFTPLRRPGLRAPHAWLRSGRSTLDEVGPWITVLAPPHHDIVPVGAFPAAVVALDLDARRNDAQNPYAGNDDVTLVRPDGITAWSGPSARLPSAWSDWYRVAP